MPQRRTPSGQGPARRPGQPGRSGSRGPLRLAGRDSGRDAGQDNGSRADQRGRPARPPATDRSGAPRSVGGRSGAGRSGDPGRPASRPAAGRRVPGGPVKRTTAPQPNRFTGRATVLLVVLVALALAYTYPVRVYLAQQSDIARIEQAQQAQRERIAELNAQAERWQDPDFIRIEAKRRFYMVYPGEVPLLVLHDPAGAARDSGEPVEPAGDRGGPAGPWYDTLWSSVQAADAEGVSQ